MGEVMHTDQYQLKNSLNDEFMSFYLAIRNAYRRYGSSCKFSQVLKQFSEYFYHQVAKKKQYKRLRSRLMRSAQTSRDSQRYELFSDGKMTGFLYALPAKDCISTDLLDGNISILTVDHGALQIEQKTNIQYRLHHQRLTHGQSSICLNTTNRETCFQAKTSVAVFLCVSCNDVIYE
ncbi:MAG: hypothetical protein KAH03_06630 [Cocleimonas sp.]|nr:hypothetical protein [Cocleimonas sp.]